MAAGTHIPTIAAIQKAVAEQHGVPVEGMTEPDGIGARLREKAWPRQEAMWLAVMLTEHSLVRIGHFFGRRDHSTIISACRAVEARRKRNPRLHAKLRKVTLEVLGRG